MAITGFCFCCFLSAHLMGNLLIYAGGEAFNSYANRLHSLGAVITMFELTLLIIAIVHVSTGVILFVENLKARSVKYAIKKNITRSISSVTMPYTGLILFVFVIFHLFNFHFIDCADKTIFQIVCGTFIKFEYAFIYTAAALVSAVHINHGFWSAFQTIGANHPKYTPVIKGAGSLFSVFIAAGFGFIPIFILFS